MMFMDVEVYETHPWFRYCFLQQSRELGESYYSSPFPDEYLVAQEEKRLLPG